MLKVDPITFAVVQNNMISIAKEMQNTVERCSVQPIVYETRDTSYALLDVRAGTIAQAPGCVLFLGTLGPGVNNCIDIIGQENLESGDVIIAANATITGAHSLDGLLFTPIFYKDTLFGYATSKIQWFDLGAKSFYPTDTTSIFEEGLQIPPIKLYKKGNLQQEIRELINWNSRGPDLVWGDIQAQIAGCRQAEKRVIELLDRYDIETVSECIEEMYDYSERITRSAIDQMPDGTWSAEDYMDDNGVDRNKPVRVKVTVTVRGSNITIDFAGSDKEQRGPTNCPFITTLSAARAAVKALTTPELPANEGCYRPIKVIAPEHSLFNPSPTAPTFLYAWPGEVALEVINKALCGVLPQRVPACSGGDICAVGFSGQHPKTGKHWWRGQAGLIGSGADFFSDGENALIHLAMGGGRNMPIEVEESNYPLLIEQYALVEDSGGAGRYRGGLGTIRDVRLLARGAFFSMMEKCKTPHWGINGGKPGMRNYSLIQSRTKGELEVIKCPPIELDKGDRVSVVAGGGGGYGDPLERDIEAVRQDAINGYVSLESAKRDYGVVIDPHTFDIDIKATKELRG